MQRIIISGCVKHCGVHDRDIHARACTQEKLGDAVCWSNGNLFRCITLLAVTHLEKAGIVRVFVCVLEGR